jgi:hypothetical protein
MHAEVGRSEVLVLLSIAPPQDKLNYRIKNLALLQKKCSASQKTGLSTHHEESNNGVPVL